MTDDLEASHPERKLPARLVVQERSSLTTYGWSVWASILLLSLLTILLGRTALLVAVAVVTIATLSGLLYLERAARKVRWILLLDNGRLSITRTPPLGRQAIAELDVGVGVHIDVVGDARATRLDLAIALTTSSGQRATWSPGLRPARAIDLLATFLRANDVVVTLPSNAPVVLFPLNYPPGGTS